MSNIYLDDADRAADQSSMELAQKLARDPSCGSAPLPPPFLTPVDGNDTGTKFEDIEQVKHRALRRAEQLSNIYLDDADRAADQSSMELAQKLAAQSIVRLAGLRHLASKSGLQ